jgi:hypothetical protein
MPRRTGSPHTLSGCQGRGESPVPPALAALATFGVSGHLRVAVTVADEDGARYAPYGRQLRLHLQQRVRSGTKNLPAPAQGWDLA